MAGLGCAAVSASAQAPRAPAPVAETVLLSAFEVTTTQDKGYKATNAIGATRTNTPIADTPQSIGVFNDLFIEDTQSFDLTPLTYFDPTFVPAQPDRGSFISRGFTVNATFVDGLPQRNTFGPNYTANVDRVEILKGPAAILYGQGAGGATINRVLKRARPVFNTVVTATFADFGVRRAQLDTGGPIGLKVAQRKLAYRFNAVWQEGHTFKRNSRNDDVLYSPTFSIPLGRRTDLDVAFTYHQSNLTGNFAHPVVNGVPGRVNLTGGGSVHIPIRSAFGEPFDERPVEKTLSSYDFRHQFNRALSFRSQYQFETYNAEFSEIFPQIGQYVLTPTTAAIRRVYREQNTDTRADRARNELVADFATGPLRHKALAGFSFDETNEYQLFYQNAVAAVPAMDVINPVFGRYAVPAAGAVPVATDQQTKAIARAWYLNELVSLADGRVFVQAGVRAQDTYQRVNNRRTRAVSAIPTSADTYSLGAVWHLTAKKTVSLWAATSEAFEPNFRVNPDGETLDPTTGNTDEGGLKFDLFDSVLNGTLSAFKTKRSNVPEAAPDLGVGFFRSAPGQTSQGFELSASFNPSRRLQLNGGYAYLDAFDTRTKRTVANLSQHAFSGFARYEQPGGVLKGVFATVGYIYRGTRVPTSGAAQPEWIIPEFKRLDLGLGYGWKAGRLSYRVSANLENATDELLFGDNNQNDRYGMLAPRTWRLAIRTQF
jgi:outer membrane receptor protein involved in Fe transport